MGKLNLFAVDFPDNPTGVYHAGQTLNGALIVELNEPMEMRGVRVILLGKANVHWTEQHSSGSGKNRTTRTVHYSANEFYFNHTITVFGKAAGQPGDNPTLGAGRHVFPFNFILPPTLPSSFEGQWGRVRYHAKGEIDRPWRFDHVTKRAFTVISQLDLNTQPQAMSPQQGTNSKTLCCLCCASGPITGVLKIPRTGYVPGEKIQVQAEINNMSRRKMDRSMIQLRQTISFHATTKTRTSHSMCLQMVKGEIPPGETEYWRDEVLQIPPLPPSKLIGCNIIDIQYYIVLVVDPSGLAFDLEVPLNVILGTVPHHMVYNYSNWYGAQPALPSAPAMPPQPTAPPATDPTLPNIAPPTYSECVFGKVNIRDEEDNDYTRGDLNYAPVYTYYQGI